MCHQDDELFHYGTPRHSGRYPWGSGDNPHQHDGDMSFRQFYSQCKAKGMSDKDIAKGMGINENQLRKKKALESEAERIERYSAVYSLADSGKSATEIEKITGIRESTIRGILKRRGENNVGQIQRIANSLKERIADGSYLDVGEGSNLYLQGSGDLKDILKISEVRMDNVLDSLEKEGYSVETIRIDQLTNPGKSTPVKLLAPPGTTKQDMHNNLDKIKSCAEFTTDQETGETRLGIKFPKSLDSSRMQIVWPDEGGAFKDGVIELRRGVQDISLGDVSYSQVRIAVDGTHYLKGMAIYADDLPDGVDVRFNTSKPRGSAVFGKVLKPFERNDEGEIDKDNPFGAAIKIKNGVVVGQSEYTDANGNKQLSLINKVNEEGDWDKWSRTLASQFLSKQNVPLIKRQLDVTYAEKKAEYEDILSLTNNEVKKALLAEWASKCDNDAVELKAAPFAGQAQKVILPITSMKENECYAPTYPNGTKLVLIRYPHAGTFELPTVTVNNNHVEARKIFGDLQDAIAIGPTTAQQLSGADFDGDSVTAIPLNGSTKINTQKYPKELLDFGDFHERYSLPPDAKKVKDDKSFNKGMQMGMITNLITDMTVKGAPIEKIIPAVKHSMVIIDAEKHNLDWRRSAIENGIPQLKEEWQGRKDSGASTLISRSKSVEYVDERKMFSIDKDTNPETGEKIFRQTGKGHVSRDANGELKKDKFGEVKWTPNKEKSTKMFEAEDAYKLSSGTPKENLYADYANKMKAMANDARKQYMATPNSKVDRQAVERYSEEVKSLKAQLMMAEKNAPLERYSQIMGTNVLKAKMSENPKLTYRTDEGKEKIRKVKNQAIAQARARYGAHRVPIDISDREWEAIQAHAIGSETLRKILRYSKPDRLRELATPRTAKTTLQPAKQSWLRALKSQGYTTAEIAERTGLSTSTIVKYTKAGAQ